MKLVKVILSIIVSFSLLWILVALFSPKSMGVTESIVIEQSRPEVFSQVNELKNWNYWSEWYRKDSTIVYKYAKTTSGKGASMTWHSEDEGDGEQTIIESIPYEKIRIQLRISEWGENYMTWTFNEIESFKTEITWTFEDSEIAFLFRPLAFSFNSSIRGDITKGLANLKQYAENLPRQNKKLVPTIVEAEPFFYVGKHISCDFENIGPEMGKAYAELMKLCSENNWNIEGMPLSIYSVEMSDKFECDVAFKLDRLVEAPEGFLSGEIKGGETLTMSHFGLYENLPASYEVIESWMKSNGYDLRSAFYEIYVTDPGEEPDSSKWETQLFYPIQKAF